ncbi:photosynthetic NDH subunit of subcomplex B 4, chloroplastic isoform X2 [Phragmites australis]|uniref:photosynthetic NDH subunit of subcomplex B 4, chloroplastic isoform X2 n=1 Tax=Phragmites australis TaxID=29695 RepID=UPI002D76AB55|nr:photosynthetic NDH subunit of subcomplex B 4, chloroplastic isoform X2 [Phragmites australis]
MASPLLKSHSHFAAALQPARRTDLHGRCPASVHLGRFPDHGFSSSHSKSAGKGSVKVNAFPSLDVVPLMAMMVEHVDNSRDYVVHKSIWHLSDAAIKSVYTFYAMFTVWGVCFFASMKDPFYDSDTYRSQGGDGTVHWYYDRQEDLEASAREELLREELLEEIEQRVGGFRELEEAGKEEQLTN